jgi:hypothetical protein
MKLPHRLLALVAVAVLLAGCGGPLLPKSSTDSPAQTSATTPAGGTTVTPMVSTATPAATDQEQAIKDVVQKANDEQQRAFAANDPTLMRDTAVPDYYQEMAQNQSDMQRGGVTAIKLLKLEWDSVSVQGTSAQATTFETWQTTYRDGSVEQDRERNVYTLVQQNGAWLVQADDHPDSGLDQSPGGSVTSPNPNPVPRPSGATGADVSDNWSGYAATDGAYTAVSGTWVVPTVNADNGDTGAGDATWVGIGGTDSHDLIQAGTDAAVLGTGRVRYSAWIEMLPAVAQTVPLTVSPGDTVSASITRQSGTNWQITLQNRTTGQQYQTTVQYTSSLSSAEWIEEAPVSGRQLVTLDNFGSVQFTEASAVKDGKQVTAQQAGASAITMVNRAGQAVAKPGAIGADGGSFTVTRQAATASPPTSPRLGRRGSQ